MKKILRLASLAQDDEQGVSLIESLLVVVMVGIIIVLLANLPNAFNLINRSKNLSLAREIAAKQIEDKRDVGFTNLAVDTSPIINSRISLLPGGGGSVVVEDYGDNLKLVTVDISWTEQGFEQTVKLQTLVGEGGLSP